MQRIGATSSSRMCCTMCMRKRSSPSESTGEKSAIAATAMPAR
jgi:hypothetical protein